MRFLNGLWFVEGPLFFQSVSSKDDSVTVFPVRISSERFSTQTVSSDVWIDQHQFCWTACERVQMDLSQHLSSASGSPLSSPLPPFSCLWRWLVWVGHVVLVGSCIQTTRVALTRAACLKKKNRSEVRLWSVTFHPIVFQFSLDQRCHECERSPRWFLSLTVFVALRTV